MSCFLQSSKVVSEGGTDSWWRCCEYCWKDKKRFRILLYTSFINKAAAGFERTDSNFERSSTVGSESGRAKVLVAQSCPTLWDPVTVACQAPLWCKMLSDSITCHREIFHERKSQSMLQTSLLSLRNCDTHLNLCNYHPDQSAVINNGG